LTSHGLGYRKRLSITRRIAMWKKTDASSPTVEQPIAPQPPAPQQVVRESGVIGPSITIKGDISGDGDLVIQGRVEGRVELRRNNITIGKNGAVKADIYGKVISIEGEVQGNVYGEEKIIIRSSGVLRGNIVAPRVNLEEGSKFKGSIDMDSKSQEKPLAGSAEAKPPETDDAAKAVSEPVRKSGEDGKKPSFSLKADQPHSRT
jgi:cytoskeletal protein CcmA (bactofilin family)